MVDITVRVVLEDGQGEACMYSVRLQANWGCYNRDFVENFFQKTPMVISTILLLSFEFMQYRISCRLSGGNWPKRPQLMFGPFQGW